MNKLTIKKKVCAYVIRVGFFFFKIICKFVKKADGTYYNYTTIINDMKKNMALDAEEKEYSESDKKFLKKMGLLD